MGRIVKRGLPISELKARAAELDKFKAFIGWLDSAQYDDGTPVAGVAAVQEYGSVRRNIPPRPFLRNAIAKNEQEWRALIEKGANAILSGKSTAEQVMELLGLKVEGDIKTAIKELSSPALDPKTIEARKRKKADGKTIGNLTKPLVEEAIMINSVTHEVRE